MKRKIRIAALVAAAVGGLWVLHAFYPFCLVNSRYGQLRCVIDHNVGHAHMTRGMNTDTIEALFRHATVADIPLLVQMLDDSDHVSQMTAAEVLARMGPAGLQALHAARDSAKQHPETNDAKRRAIETVLEKSTTHSAPQK